jgi:hypothetical protein
VTKVRITKGICDEKPVIDSCSLASKNRPDYSTLYCIREVKLILYEIDSFRIKAIYLKERWHAVEVA